MGEENKGPACKPCEDCGKKELTNEEQKQVDGGSLMVHSGWFCKKCHFALMNYDTKCIKCGAPKPND